MEITVKTLESKLNGIRYILWPEHHYHYVDCSFKVVIMIDDMECLLVANTSGLYNEDPNLKSNKLELDKMVSSRIIYEAFRDYVAKSKLLNDEQIAKLNESLGLLLSTMQQTVVEWQQKADKQLADDKNIYIESSKINYNESEKQLHIFEPSEAPQADNFATKTIYSESRVYVCKEYARSTYPWRFQYEY